MKYQLGVVTADSQVELGTNAINHLGLTVDNHPLEINIGRRVNLVIKRKGKKTLREPHVIVGVQKMWGYDENGNYVFGIVGYRIARDEQDFGRPATVDSIEFTD